MHVWVYKTLVRTVLALSRTALSICFVLLKHSVLLLTGIFEVTATISIIWQKEILYLVNFQLFPI